MLISLNNLTFGYDDVTVLEDVDVTVNENDRIGLVGVNGSGKSTLIKLMLGFLHADWGEVLKKSELSVGYLPQNAVLDSELTVESEAYSVFSEVLAAGDKMEALANEMAALPHDGTEYRIKSAEYEKVSDFFRVKDGYLVTTKVKTVLNGMGFSSKYDQVVSTLSGGEKTRLALSKLLLKNPELLVLDEPTNHLDYDTLEWLEKYLSDYKGAILVVSHDRRFLDKTVNVIWDLTEKTVSSYRGNYTKFKQLKAERYERWQKEYKIQQEKLRRMQDYVDRNLVRATTSKSAKSRIHQMANMDIIEKPVVYVKPPRFKFDYAQKPAKLVLKVDDLSLGFDGNSLLEHCSFTVEKGERVAVVGANGTGKSTLIKRLVKSFSEPERSVVFGQGTKVAYYDQEAAVLDGENTVLTELWSRHISWSQTEVRNLLGMVLMGSDVDVQKKVKNLSGGEKARLMFAVMMAEKANVLILDEPTNHLDLQAREALEDALSEFDGTLIFVSHDRYFLDKLAKRYLKISDKNLVDFRGTFDEFSEAEKRAKEEIAAAKSAEKTQKTAASERPEKAYRSKADRALEVKKKAEIAALEGRIKELEDREKEIVSEMEKCASDYKKLMELSAEAETVKAECERLFDKWTELTI